jgi:asparaginyl-tRNA synthetase
MQRVLIRDLPSLDGQAVTLSGWMCGRRRGGKILFLQIRDGTGTCQCVVDASSADAFAAGDALSLESSVVLTGVARRDERSPGGMEVRITSLALLGDSVSYPISRKAHGIDFLMSHRHLWLRSRRPSAILRIRHTLIRACRDFFDGRGFTLVDTPILVCGAGEDAQTLFPVRYFDRDASLAQTGQLYLESACMSLGQVYCFGPTFRAEKSKTRRHLTEFWMIEPEVAFADLDAVIALAEDLVCFVVGRVLEAHEADLQFLGRDTAKLRNVQKPFRRMTYSEAVDVLRSDRTRQWLEEELLQDKRRLRELMVQFQDLEQKLAAESKPHLKDAIQVQLCDLREDIDDLEVDVRNRPEHIRLAQSFEWGKDLGGSDETLLSRQSDRPVFVTDYPKEAKAFYMKRPTADSRTVRNVDLLAPEGYGEIIGGSQREENLSMLEDAMRGKGLNPEDYSWYSDLRRYGTVPHGGFGMGIERALTWICGLKHVRETIPFPRTMGRIYP